MNKETKLPEWIETLAESWDGCMYDAPGDTLDIGASIRNAARKALSQCLHQLQEPSTEVQEAWRAGIDEGREQMAALATTPVAPADPMDWPLPCAVTVGHGTMGKGVKLSTLVLRMKVLYKMATGDDADEVAARTPEQRAQMLQSKLATIQAVAPVDKSSELQCSIVDKTVNLQGSVAAQVELPEPAAIALSKRESSTKDTVEFQWGMDAFKIAGPHALYTEQQVRAMATGGQVQAVKGG